MESEIPTLVPHQEDGVGKDFASRMQIQHHPMKDLDVRRVPVTILTGFLGAGKSTLLGRILKERHGMKIAVILNEVGPSAQVDKAILWDKQKVSSEEWLQVENGCLCCTAKNDTFLALESLLKRREDIEHIVIEASGAADPAALVEKLWIDEALESHVVLDGVVGVFDCCNGARLIDADAEQGGEGRKRDYSVEAARQLAISDLILLNKVDLLDDDQLTISKIKSTINRINPIATQIETIQSNAPLDIILNLASYKPSRTLEEQQSLLDKLANISLTSHAQSGSDRKISSFSVDLRKHSFDLNKFEKWLFSLLWEGIVDENVVLGESDDIMRIKGIIQSSNPVGGGRRRFYSLQVVQDKYDLQPLLNESLTKIQPSLIFIGRISEESKESIIRRVLSLHC